MDTQNVDSIIFGRIDPQIYAFSTCDVSDSLKVGDTYRPLDIRLDEWRRYYPNLKLRVSDSARIDDNRIFRDTQVHRYLVSKAGRKRLERTDFRPGVHYSCEFFKDATADDVRQGIADIRADAASGGNFYYINDASHIPVQQHYTPNKLLTLRDNQQIVVNNFVKAVAAGRRHLLMFAVMRFGKTFTSMCCANAIDARRVIIVSAKAAVADEWQATVEGAANFKDWLFISHDTLLRDNHIASKAVAAGKRVALFLTLQDLCGNSVKKLHTEVFNSGQWDLLLVDETHFGARAPRYGEVLANGKYLYNKIEQKQLDKDDEFERDGEESLDKLTREVKGIDAQITMHLSGTPYRILMGSEFAPEDIVAFVQYKDIADAKRAWDEKHINTDGVNEWDNPYYGFPKMVRFTFNPNEESLAVMRELERQGASSSLSELFRPKSLAKSNPGRFVFRHSKAVLDLLKAIDGTKQDENIFSFLDYKRIQEGYMCRHIVMVLPYCASCDALERLIIDNKNALNHFNDYDIVNISGLNAANKFKSPDDVKAYIRAREAENVKTLTLTVNRMMTGSTVPEWDTMIYLKNTRSPQEYDQAVFRLQTPYIKSFVDSAGNEVKQDLKPQTLLVDFAPSRVLLFQELKGLTYNTNVDVRGNDALRNRIGEELKVSPLIILDNNGLREVTPKDVIDAVRHYSASRSVVDEAVELPVDVNLFSSGELFGIIKDLPPIKSRRGFLYNPASGGPTGSTDPKLQDSDNGQSMSDSTADADDNDAGSQSDNSGTIESLGERVSALYARILLYAFIVDKRVKSLSDIISSISYDEENTRIANSLSLNEKTLGRLHELLPHGHLSQLDCKIENINELANDETLSVSQRVTTAMTKFGRISASEIITPIKVANMMLADLPEDALDGPVLDIASKTAEFAVAIYEQFGKEKALNVISLCTSPLTYEFTRKIYTLLGLPVANIISDFTSYDLIRDAGCKKKIKEMNIRTIIGNPPYQESVNSSGSNTSLSRQLFPSFIRSSDELSKCYAMLITPSRWFAGEAQDGSFTSLRDYIKNNQHYSKLTHFGNANELFSDVTIKGGVSYMLSDKKHDGEASVTVVSDGLRQSTRRSLFDGDRDILVADAMSLKVLKQVNVKPSQSLMEIASGRNAFGFVGKDTFVRNNSTTIPFEGAIEVRCKNGEVRYTAPANCRRNPELVNKHKVFISKSAGDPATDRRVIGTPYIGTPHSICTDSLIPIGCFDNLRQAEALRRYLMTRFARYMVSISKVSQNVCRNVYQNVPLFKFTIDDPIDWSVSVNEIDEQLFDLYKLDSAMREHILSSIDAIKG